MKGLVFAGISLTLLMGSAHATDPASIMAVKAPPAPAPYDWTGYYVGAHLGYAAGSSNWSAASIGTVAPTLTGSLDLYNSYEMFKGTGSYFAGFQAGYNYLLPSRILLGIEADTSFPNTIAGAATISSPSIGVASYSEQVEFSGTLRGRIGYAPGHWLLYATGGFAWSYDQYTRTQLTGVPTGGTAQPGQMETLYMVPRVGGAAGIGVELALTPNWAVRLEYLYTDYASRSVNFPGGAQRFDSDLALQTLRVGVDYQLGHDGIDPYSHQRSVCARPRPVRSPRPNNFYRAIRPPVPLALSWSAQPRSEPGTRELGRHVFCGRQIVARRRGLGRSGDRSGLRVEQYRGYRRLPQRGLLQGRRFGPVLTH
jgi:high affinity Mn2+ porin